MIGNGHLLNWFSPLLATITLVFTSVSIASLIGLIAAWALEMSQSGGAIVRRILSPLCFLACVAAVLTPMILHAGAWEATAGKFGMTMLTQTGARATSGERYSFFAGGLATSWIHGIHGAGVIAIITLLGVQRTPPVLSDPAKMLLSRNAAFWKVDLPLASPWCGSAMVLVAMLAVTEMTVADLYGYRTVADQFYLYYAADPNLASVFTVCFLPLAIAISFFIWGLVARRRMVHLPAHFDRAVGARDQGGRGDGGEQDSLLVQLISAIAMVAVIGLLVAVPFFGILNKLGQTVSTVGDGIRTDWQIRTAIERLLEAPRWFASEYQWTAIISLTSGLLATGLAWMLVSLSHRHRHRRVGIDIASVLLICVPGPVVGLAVIAFFQSDLPGFRYLMQQTIFPTVIACLARAVPLAYWVLRAGYASTSEDVLNAASLRVGWLRRFWWIECPLVLRWGGLALVVSTVFASGDLPATQPVIPAGIATVPVRLFGLLHSGARYQEAALAFWYLLGMAVISSAVMLAVPASFQGKQCAKEIRG